MKGLVQFLTESKKKTPIFTVAAFNITQDEGIDDMKYGGATYYSEDEAIDAAREFAATFKGDEDHIEVSVYAGEYETEDGDIYGEHDAIYTISNKNKKETAKSRKAAGYSSDKVDEYVTESTKDNCANLCDYGVEDFKPSKKAVKFVYVNYDDDEDFESKDLKEVIEYAKKKHPKADDVEFSIKQYDKDGKELDDLYENL